MTLAVDTIHGRGPSNKMHPQLQPKKTKVRLYYSNNRCYKRCTLLTRRSAVLAVDMMHGHAPSNKMRPQLQPKKTEVWLY